MRWHLKQFIALARLTALEAIRQPVFLLLMAAAVFFMALLPLITAHTMGEGERMVRDSALALYFVTGLVLGSYLACAALQHEIRRGTVAAILAKPVGRTLLFCAKFAGVAAVMVLFATALTITTLLATRRAGISRGLVGGGAAAGGRAAGFSRGGLDQLSHPASLHFQRLCGAGAGVAGGADLRRLF
jgi:hypothetical protein